MTELTSSRGFTRRSFIKGVAAVTAAGALAGCTPKEDDKQQVDPVVVPETQIFAGACRGNCAGGCFLNVHVRDGQIVRTTARDTPDPAYTRICSRGLTHPFRVYSPKRLQYPMKRVGERGAGEFERISWEEAITTIAERWSSLTNEFGAESMAVLGGSGNFAICSGAYAANSAMLRFLMATGAALIQFNVDRANVYAYSHIVGDTPFASLCEATDWKNAKTFISWGSNPAISQPQLMHFILEAKESGTKYVVIDPVYNANTSKADWFLPVNATTDGVLALGALNEVFAKGWIDEDFVRAHTEAAALVKSDGTLLRKSDIDPSSAEESEGGVDPLMVWDASSNTLVEIDKAQSASLSGVVEVDGIPVRTVLDIVREKAGEYTPERVKEITGISEENVKELARLYGEEGPVTTYIRFGSDHYLNGHYNYWPMYALAILTGNIGKSGASCGFAELKPDSISNVLGVLMPTGEAGETVSGMGRIINVNKMQEVLDTGMYGDAPLTIKGVYITNANSVSNHVAHNYTTTWLKQVEFVVVADMNMTETAKYADILLPAAHWFEQVDLSVSFSSAPYIMWNEKSIEPLYESKSDFDIYRLLTKELGCGWAFDLEPEDFIKTWLDCDGARGLGISFDKLKEEKIAKALPGDTFIAYEGGLFATDTGRAKFYRDVVVSDYYLGQEIDESKERTLYWEPAREATHGTALRDKYPFHLISEHMRTRTHSQWWDVDMLKEVEPGPVLKMNPHDAEQLGLKEGDMAKAFNDRGYMVAPVVYHRGNPRGTVSVLRSYQQEEYVDGHLASLSSEEYNQVCANQAFNDVAVGIEKL